MATPILPREGCWVGGLTDTGFSVQCRGAAADTYTLEVSQDSNFGRSDGTVSSMTLHTDQHFRSTVYVTDLTPGVKYYWRVKLVEVGGAAAVVTGTSETWTAGSLRTHKDGKRWKCAVLGCQEWDSFRANIRAQAVSDAYGVLLAQDYDFHIHTGDIFYSDTFSQIPAAGIVDYAVANFYAPSATVHADAVALGKAGYRTNFINTYTAVNTGGDYSVLTSRSKDYINTLAEFKCRVPGYNMPDDHDRAFNDCSDRANAVGDEATRWDLGRDVVHECFMNLNKNIIDSDTDSSGAARTFTPYTSEDMYYVIDIAPARFIVLDTRSYRDANADADATTKSMLGAEQKSWLKARILDNPEKFLFIITGSMLDGYHGFNDSLTDTWVNFSYERDEILDYIWANGRAKRTVFISGDTHNHGIYKYKGQNDNADPIYEMLSGNAGWTTTHHDWINGLKAGDSGNGAIRELTVVNGLGCAQIEHIGADRIRLALYITHPGFVVDGSRQTGQRKGIVWQKIII